MSFILDALKRSHAEREQNSNAEQPKLELLQNQSAAPERNGSAWWFTALGGAAGALVALGAIWWWADGGSAPAVSPVAENAPAAERVSLPASAPAPTAAAPAQATRATQATQATQATAAAISPAVSSASVAASTTAPDPTASTARPTERPAEVAAAASAASLRATGPARAAATGQTPAAVIAPTPEAADTPAASPPAESAAWATATRTRARSPAAFAGDALPAVPDWARETGPEDDVDALVAAARPRSGAGGAAAANRSVEVRSRSGPAGTVERPSRPERSRPAAASEPTAAALPRTGPDAAAVDEALAGVPHLATLDPSFRDSLPRYQINALMYSQTPAERLVILDLKRYREGDRTRDGARVTRIARKGVVLDKAGRQFVVTTP